MSKETLPLLHDGDSYLLTLDSTSSSFVSLVQILRYPNNLNTTPDILSFRDLSPSCKQAVIQQINRRYRGRTVKV